MHDIPYRFSECLQIEAVPHESPGKVPFGGWIRRENVAYSCSIKIVVPIVYQRIEKLPESDLAVGFIVIVQSWNGLTFKPLDEIEKVSGVCGQQDCEVHDVTVILEIDRFGATPLRWLLPGAPPRFIDPSELVDQSLDLAEEKGEAPVHDRLVDTLRVVGDHEGGTLAIRLHLFLGLSRRV